MNYIGQVVLFQPGSGVWARLRSDLAALDAPLLPQLVPEHALGDEGDELYVQVLIVAGVEEDRLEEPHTHHLF